MSLCSTRDIEEMVQAFIDRKRFVYLCTNGVLMRRKLDRFRPSPYFSWVVHIDGLRSATTRRSADPGCSTRRSSAIREAKEQGFRVTTNSTFFNTDSPARCARSSTT